MWNSCTCSLTHLPYFHATRHVSPPFLFKHDKFQTNTLLVVSARDAIIQADRNRYGGSHVCALWRVFASRGLGLAALPGVYINDFVVPIGC